MVERSYGFAIMATILFLIAIVVFMIGFFDIGGKKKSEENTEENEDRDEEMIQEQVPADEEAEGYTDTYGERITLENVDGRIEEDTNRWILIMSGVLALLALICLIAQLKS